MKIHLAGIATETNSFAMLPTGLGAWAVHRGVPETGRETLQPTLPPTIWHQAASHLAAEGGHQLGFGLLAEAQPGGTTVGTVYEALRDELLARLQADLPVDAVLLPLHGAMVADGHPDCEGDLLTRVRALVGPGVAIGVALDLHCHFTEAMRLQADVIVSYKAYPHTDMAERFAELWQLALATAQRRIRPVTAVFDCQMLSFWHTTREPMAGFVRRLQALEGQGRILSVSFGHGFPWGDVAEAGAKVWVITDGDEALAAHWAATLGREIQALRHQTAPISMGLEEALDRLQTTPPGTAPMVIADTADNAGGGAASDSTFILQGLLNRGIDSVVLGAYWDLGAVQVCRDAGEGARLALRVGGKCGPASGAPVDLPVTVMAIRADHTQTVLGHPGVPCGPSVWVRSDGGLDLVLISQRQQVFGTDLFTGLGIDLSRARAIVVKSSQHFHAAFAPLASAVLYVETPGLLRTDFANLPYQHRSRQVWPLLEEPWTNPEAPHEPSATRP